ncbi:MAG: NYN domain-containing protein [bacterium]|nr:NYN domain-containing protein [bacterium]
MGTAALLVDFENYYVGGQKARESDKAALAAFPEVVEEDMQSLLDYTKELVNESDLRIVRAYADFIPPAGSKKGVAIGVRDQLNAIGFETLDVPGKEHKNSAENQLIVDAIELQLLNAEIETFVLAGSDGDLRPLVIALKKRGARVVVVGFGNAKLSYRAVADQFLYLEELKDVERLRRSLLMREKKDELAKHTEAIAKRIREVLSTASEVRLGVVVQLLETVHPVDFASFGYTSAEQYFRDQGTGLGTLIRRRGRDYYLTRRQDGSSQADADAENLARDYMAILTRKSGANSNHRRPVWVGVEDWEEITRWVFEEIHHAASFGDFTSLATIRALWDVRSENDILIDKVIVDDVIFQIRDSQCLQVAAGPHEGKPATHENQKVVLSETTPSLGAFRFAVQVHMFRKLERELEESSKPPARLEGLLVMFTGKVGSWEASEYQFVETIMKEGRG